MPKVLRECRRVSDWERQQLFLRRASTVNSETTLSKLNENGTHHGEIFKRHISMYFFCVEETTVLDWISQLNNHFVRTFTEHVPSCTHMGGFSCCGGEDRTSTVHIFDLSNFYDPSKYETRTFFHRFNGGKARRKVVIDIPTSVFIDLTKWLLEIMNYHQDLEAGDKPEVIEIRYLDNKSKRWFLREWVGKVLELNGLPSEFVKIKQDPNNETRLRLSV